MMWQTIAALVGAYCCLGMGYLMGYHRAAEKVSAEADRAAELLTARAYRATSEMLNTRRALETTLKAWDRERNHG